MIVRISWNLGLSPSRRARLKREVALRRLGEAFEAVGWAFQRHMEEEHGDLFLI